MALQIRDLRQGDARGDEAGQAVPYKTVVILELDATGEFTLSVTLPHNPESCVTSYRARWKPRQAPGVTHDRSDFEGFDPASRSFAWLGAAQDAQRFEDEVLAPLELAMQSIVDETQEAPRVTLLQGTKSMRGHLADLRIKRVRTDAAGRATVAELELTLIQNDPSL